MSLFSVVRRQLRQSPSLRRTTYCRHVSTSRYDPTRTRNLAVVAHIDSGKTTLTESILLETSYLASAGTVDTGSTTTDFLPAERERGITIQSASIPVKWNDWNINLIDTPGHADFGMEVESASRVVDGAVVLIDSVEGVEAQTKGVWRQLDRYGVPTRILFMNKLDRPGASFHLSMLSLLSHRIHPKPMALTLPIASFDSEDYKLAEPGIQGLVDLVRWEVWKWNSDGSSTRHPLPTDIEALEKTELFPSNHPILPHLAPARSELIENLSMFSESLMEKLLDLPSSPSAYLSVPSSLLVPHLRAATLRADILPVLCGSAMKHIGTKLVLDYAGELLASPVDVPHEKQSPKSPLALLAWKVTWDKRKGWMTFVRVYSGTLTKQSVLVNSTRNQKERVSKLLLLYANEAEEVDELPFGSVGVILGLKHTRTGDLLTSTHNKAALKNNIADIAPPPAVMSASVVPQSHSDLEHVEESLQALARTDPSVRVETQDGQLLIHGLGALHLEIVEGRLRDEWNANFEFGRRRVSYREAFSTSEPSSPPSDSWSTTIGGKTMQSSVKFSLRPLDEDEAGDPIWDGNVVLKSDGEPLPLADTILDHDDPLRHISQGVANALSNSPNSTLPLSRAHITVSSFEHPPGTPHSILAGASAVILRNAVKARGMGSLMEPFINLRISVTEDSLGKVVKDLTESGGEVLDMEGSSVSMDGEEVTPYPQEGLYIPPKWLSPSTMSSTGNDLQGVRQRRYIHAVAPLSRMLDYSTRLRALSGGHGLFEMSAAGFKVVADGRKLEILKEMGRA